MLAPAFLIRWRSFTSPPLHSVQRFCGEQRGALSCYDTIGPWRGPAIRFCFEMIGLGWGRRCSSRLHLWCPCSSCRVFSFLHARTLVQRRHFPAGACAVVVIFFFYGLSWGVVVWCGVVWRRGAGTWRGFRTPVAVPRKRTERSQSDGGRRVCMCVCGGGEPHVWRRDWF